MVAKGILALALALPTGALFGVGYGTGVRIGYEQVYPLLFPKDAENRNVTPTVENIKKINQIYDTIGGKEASQMGIGAGVANAIEDIKKNLTSEDYKALILEQSGLTPSSITNQPLSEETKLSDFSLDSSSNVNSDNFNAEYYVHILKQKGWNEQNLGPYNDKEKLMILAKLEELNDSNLRTRYKNKSHFDTRMQQLITVVYKKRFGNPAATRDTEGDLVLEPTQAEKEYQVWHNSLMANASLAINSHRLMERKSLSNSVRNVHRRNYLKQQKDVMEIIQKGRNSNNHHIKNDATTKWNNRWWKSL